MNVRAALVTGGARRLGKAMALGLAKRGAAVAVHFFSSSDEAAATVALIRDAGGHSVPVKADLLDEDTCRGLVAHAAEGLGQPLDVLINNASIFEHDSIETATADSWNRHMMSNLRAPFVLMQEFAPQAPKADQDPFGELHPNAAIINIVDQRVRKPTPEFMTYTLAKMGLWNLTRIGAAALAPDIRVNAIGPGPTVRAERQSEEHFRSQRSATPLRRGASRDEIVAAMNFLLDSPSVTGQLICPDGGQHLAWQTPNILMRRA